MLLYMNEIKFPVVEVFDSIDGEGIFAGTLATFIRLYGCNIRCSYCDTIYAVKDGYSANLSVVELLQQVDGIGNKHVTLTGGEPLIHKDVDKLIKALCENHIVNIETNGTIDIEPFQVDNTVITMDYKTISSGMSQHMLLSNLEKLRECDVLKIVCNASDFEDIRRLLLSHDIKSYVYLSPIYGEIEPVQIVNFMKELREDGVCTDKYRVQLQLHKIIWDKDLRGV